MLKAKVKSRSFSLEEYILSNFSFAVTLPTFFKMELIRAIALKESSETSYWLNLLFATGRIDEITFKSTEKVCGNIRRLLIASCKTAKENQ